MRALALVGWLALAGVVLGCAGQTRAPAGMPARAIAEQLASGAAEGAPDALVLAIERAQGAKARLIAHDVERNAVRFSVEVEGAAGASALGDVIVVQTGSELRGLDAQTGRELYRVALPEGRYVGAARAGARIAYAVVNGRPLDPQARCELAIIDARSGARTGTLELPGDAGQPVAANGLVFVPSQRQRIIAVDVARGKELARLRAQSDAIEWLQVQRSGGARTLLFGGRGFHRLVAGDAQPSASFRMPEALSALPGRPSAPESAYESQLARRIGLYVTPVASGDSEVALLAGRAYFVFYSQVFAFDAAGALVYARSLGGDAIAARVLSEGFLVATANGQLTLLSHTDGAALATQALAASAGAVLRSAELPERAPQPVAASSGAAPSPEALVRSLIELAGAVDSRLVPARIFAVERLAPIDDPAITGELLALYERPNTPAELQSALAAALSARSTGLSALVAALERRYDFLEGSRPAPLAIIAPALARGGEKAAVPGLLARLWDHETPVTALPSLARALGVLGDAETAASLLEWLTLYQADSSVSAQPEALIEVARAAHALDAKRSREAFAELLERKELAEQPRAVLEALVAPPVVAAAPVQVAAVKAPAAPPLPRLPTQRALDATFAAQLDALKPCVEAELAQNPKLLQLRIAFVAEGDGSAHGFHFAPASSALADCLYPKVASIRLPAFAEPRSVEQVTINLRAPSRPAAAASVAPSEGAPAQWWSWRATVTRPKTQPTPWWHIEQPLPPRLDQTSGTALEIESGAQPPPTTAAPTPPPEEPAWWLPNP